MNEASEAVTEDISAWFCDRYWDCSGFRCAGGDYSQMFSINTPATLCWGLPYGNCRNDKTMHDWIARSFAVSAVISPPVRKLLRWRSQLLVHDCSGQVLKQAGAHTYRLIT